MKDHKTIWYCKRVIGDNAETPSFSEPQSITTRFNYFSVMPASSRGFAEVMKYGETLNQTWTCIANANYFDGKFDIGDVFYIDGQEPNEELEQIYGYGATANAVVKNVSYVRNTISIVLEVNQAEVKE